MTEPVKSKPVRKPEIVFFVLLLIAICVVVILYSPEVKDKIFPSQETKDKMTILELVHKDALSQLKSPSSAKFPTIDDKDGVYITATEEGEWIGVRSWVDAQNSFGVYIRNYITATVEKKNGKYLMLDCWIQTTNPYN